MKKLFSLLSLFLAGATALTLTAQDNPCGVDGVVVEASSFQYSPASLEVEVGQTVVWVNMGGTHDVNATMSSIGEMWSNPENFSIGAVTGSSEGVCIGSHTFTVEGIYNYDCSIGQHAANGMVASVTVNPATQSNTVVDIIVNSEDHTLLEAAVIEG
jgi:plastocyanin